MTAYNIKLGDVTDEEDDRTSGCPSPSAIATATASALSPETAGERER
jgi:hypothetical protein